MKQEEGSSRLLAAPERVASQCGEARNYLASSSSYYAVVTCALVALCLVLGSHKASCWGVIKRKPEGQEPTKRCC
eukprot:3174353-Rhodomonas_salina.1